MPEVKKNSIFLIFVTCITLLRAIGKQNPKLYTPKKPFYLYFDHTKNEPDISSNNRKKWCVKIVRDFRTPCNYTKINFSHLLEWLADCDGYLVNETVLRIFLLLSVTPMMMKLLEQEGEKPGGWCGRRALPNSYKNGQARGWVGSEEEYSRRAIFLLKTRSPVAPLPDVILSLPLVSATPAAAAQPLSCPAPGYRVEQKPC